MFIGRQLWLLTALISALAAAACDRSEGKDPNTPSGFVVPRYVTLRYDAVNARSGPSEEHRTLWTYQTKGLPVQVVAETKDWRRICDPEGGLSWVHSRLLDGRRSIMRVKAGALALTARPEDGARTIAVLPARSIAPLERCNEDGWCLIEAGKAKGWARRSEVWGDDPDPQCRWPAATTK